MERKVSSSCPGGMKKFGSSTLGAAGLSLLCPVELALQGI